MNLIAAPGGNTYEIYIQRVKGNKCGKVLLTFKGI
jgi:hypothetical protein